MDDRIVSPHRPNGQIYDNCRYCGRTTFEYCKVVMGSGKIHIARRCRLCKSQIGQWVSKKLLKGIDLDTLPLLADYRLNNEPCAVCGVLGTELHHWAPKELFPDDFEKWPQSWLCPTHHQEWHNRITIPFRTLKRRLEKINGQFNAEPSPAISR